MHLKPQVSPLQPRSLWYNIVCPNNSIGWKSTKLELESCKATELDANIYSPKHIFFEHQLYSGHCAKHWDTWLHVVFFFPKRATAQVFYVDFQLREKRTVLLQRMVVGGKFLVMNCNVNKLLDSEVSIFLTLPRILCEWEADRMGKNLTFYSLCLLDKLQVVPFSLCL